mgnify:CR=1 FL=1
MNKRIKKKHGFDTQMNNALTVANGIPRWRRIVRLQNMELRKLIRKINRGEEPLIEHKDAEELFNDLGI